MLYNTLLVVGLLASVKSLQRIPSFLAPGKCANVPIQDNFDLQRYAGRWYNTENIENPYSPITKCFNSFYEFSEQEFGFNVTTAGFTANDEHYSMEGKIYPTREFPIGHMLLDFPEVIGNPFKIVKTDYENYSCVYSCIDWNGYKTEFGFVFSRTPQNSGPATKKCASIFRNAGVDFSDFITVPQTSECVYRS